MLRLYVKVNFRFFSVNELSLELMPRHGHISTVPANERNSKCYFRLSIIANSFIRYIPRHTVLI